MRLSIIKSFLILKNYRFICREFFFFKFSVFSDSLKIRLKYFKFITMLGKFLEEFFFFCFNQLTVFRHSRILYFKLSADISYH